MDTLWQLFDNIMIFLAMIALVFMWPIDINKNTMRYRIISGIALSVMALFTMLNSVHVGNGLYIDARYAIPIIAFIFFGTIPGLFVSVTIILVRVFILGGQGAPLGVTYVVIQAIAMFLYKRYFYNEDEHSAMTTSLRLLFVSFILQLYLLFSAYIFLPSDIAQGAVSNNWMYLLTIYPVIVFIFALVVGYRKEYYENRQDAIVSERFFELILERSPNPIIIYDELGNIQHVNEAFIKQSGYKRDEFNTLYEWFDIVKTNDDEESRSHVGIDAMVTHIPQSEHKITTKHNGVRIWTIERKHAGELPDGRRIYISIATDITEQKDYQEELLTISYNDFLTGLRNRRYYDEKFKTKTLDEKKTFVIYGDMNNLKSLNDYYGHAKGDEAIKNCAHVLKDVFGEESNIFRFGGDEFLILTQCSSKEICLNKFNEVNKRLSQYDFNEVPIDISLGIEPLSESNSLDEAIMKAESRMYEYKIFDSASARSGTVDVILTMLFEKDPETERHCKRVQRMCRVFAEKLDLSPSESGLLLRAGLLHDIGKILIPTSIILSKQRLTNEEYEIVKKHSYLGYRILSSKGYLKRIGDIVLAHHEHIDGGGYPNQLKGEEIPYFARVLSIIDAFEAMTSVRSYREKRTNEEAIQELKRCSGTQFDAELVKQFIDVVPDMPEYRPYAKEIVYE